ALRDPNRTRQVRSQIALTIGMIGDQEAADLLLNEVASGESAVEAALIGGLAKLRSKYGSLAFDVDRIVRVLDRKAAALASMQDDAVSLKGLGDVEVALFLRRAVEERMRTLIEQILRMLGIIYEQRDMHDAFYGLMAHDRVLRANALELLENL